MYDKKYGNKGININDKNNNDNNNNGNEQEQKKINDKYYVNIY